GRVAPQHRRPAPVLGRPAGPGEALRPTRGDPAAPVHHGPSGYRGRTAAGPGAARHARPLPGRECPMGLHRAVRAGGAVRPGRGTVRTQHRSVRGLPGGGGMTEARIPIALRTQALEQLLVERGLVDPAVMDTFIKMYETDIGPLNGAKVVAKA